MTLIPKGLLTRPIRRREFPDGQSFAQEQQRRFELLCQVLQVEWRGKDNTDWRALAIKLALTTVPGLSRPRSGRKRAGSESPFGWMNQYEDLMKLLGVRRAYCSKMPLASAAKWLEKNNGKLPKPFQELGWEAIRKKISDALGQEADRFAKAKAASEWMDKMRETIPEVVTDNNKWISASTGKPIPLNYNEEQKYAAEGPADPDHIPNPKYGTTETFPPTGPRKARGSGKK